MRIAIIGAGNMGGAIARGLARAADAEIEIVVSNRTRGKLDTLKGEYPRIITTTSNVEAASAADYIVVAVKPWLMHSVLQEIKSKVLECKPAIVSVVGGKTIEEVAKCLDNDVATAIFKVIPDTAISVSRGMTFISASAASNEQIETVKGMFESMGSVAVIEERLMNAATALSSCGIAYVYKYIQASVQAGVQMGFYPKDALEYTLATIEGAVAMLKANPESTPQQEIDRVTTPGGMTIRGINALEHNGFSSAIINAILEPLKK